MRSRFEVLGFALTVLFRYRPLKLRLAWNLVCLAFGDERKVWLTKAAWWNLRTKHGI